MFSVKPEQPGLFKMEEETFAASHEAHAHILLCEPLCYTCRCALEIMFQNHASVVCA